MKHILSSLKFHILMPVVLIALVNTLLVTMLVTGLYTNAILKQENESTKSQFSIIGNALEETLNTVQRFSFSSMLDESITVYASNRFAKRPDAIAAKYDCLKTIKEIMVQQKEVYGVLFMRSDHSLFGSVRYRNYFVDEPTDIIFSPEMIRQIDSMTANSIWLGPITGQELYAIKLSSSKYPENIIAGVQKVSNERYGSRYIITLIESSTIANFLSLIADNNSSVYMITSEGSVIAHVGSKEQVSEESIRMALENESSGHIIQNSDRHSLFAYTSALPGHDWYFVKEMPMQYYDQTVRQLRTMVWGGAIVLLALSLLFYFRWIRGFMRTFTALKEGIIRIKEGYINTTIDREFSISEFEEIRGEFNRLNMTLTGMMENTRELERMQLELEMRNLRTQISPHMVFNSLTAIRWYAIGKGDVEVSDMLAELSEMLRPVLREWHTMWTLREEMSHLSHYANLLDIRFGNNFRMDIDIPEAMYDMPLPRFSIQPLVENACEHGSIPNEKMLVRISARKEGTIVNIRVENNGRTITDEEIGHISEMLRTGETGQHIGLYNVFRRVRMCMGEQSGLDVQRPEEGGTAICIWWKFQ
ncbi:MAG: histidine kinase [Clostridia bacterium]|nr:histidine kinase [Clostridia bacterium]